MSAQNDPTRFEDNPANVFAFADPPRAAADPARAAR
jgi:hypothetical protein